MYPIFSLLRRYASTAIYVESGARIKLPPGVQQLNLLSSSWVTKKGLPLYEIKVEAPTSALAAQKISLKENEIAGKIKAEDRRYTLVFGPEVEEVRDGSVVRAVRITALNGIFRYRSGVVERLRRRDQNGRAVRGKRSIPHGAILETR
jgi:hypothetical protein